jgi:hypothetical protein
VCARSPVPLFLPSAMISEKHKSVIPLLAGRCSSVSGCFSRSEIKFSAKRFFLLGFILNSPFLQLRPYQIRVGRRGNLR